MRALAQATVRALARKGAAITAGARSLGPRLYTICRAWFWFENGYKSLSQTIKIIIQGFMLSPAPQA
jgi:hypothetical protein